jgi:2',3'-cyclic-nucleotide 2'-phosphodiesterase (5'-nucleotidase family)
VTRIPALPRRTVLAGGLGLAAGLVLPGRLRAAPVLPGAEALVLVMSDLHSAYERAAQTVAAVDAALAANPGVPALVAINGDVFERGNAVALRSAGAPDWAFLEALRRRAPVVLNLGNHETALVDDMAETVAAARARGIEVVSNMADERTGRPFAPHRATVVLGGRSVALVGIATDEIGTYRQPVRPTLRLPEPAAWARENLPASLAGADFAVVLSHAGVVADRRILPLLPDGTLLVGGHEHLRFRHADGRTRYVHAGSWNRAFTVAAFRAGEPVRLEEVAVEPGDPADPAVAAAVLEAYERHLTPAETEVLGRLPAPLDLPAAARLLVRTLAEAAGADVGLMSHTTLGTGLPGGDVTRYAFDAFIRFDGGLARAEVDGATLAAILERANQDGDVPLERRIGDFVYADAAAPSPDRRYGIVTTGWVRLNAERYLGRADIAFADVPDLRVKAAMAAALPR